MVFFKLGSNIQNIREVAHGLMGRKEVFKLLKGCIFPYPAPQSSLDILIVDP